jgi:hypothetical protein
LNRRFIPEEPFASMDADKVVQPSAAIVTPSYAPDFDRCRLLCETVDRFVTGFDRHYLLVERRDEKLFRRLETARRTVITEDDLLPTWLRPFDDPLSGMKRRIWLSRRTMPLRGWHVQQLRRIAVAQHAPEQALIFCDSDVVFVKPFDCASFWQNGTLRLFRRDDELVGHYEGEQKIWSRNAGAVLGIREPAVSPHDYVSTVIAWRRDSAVAMCRRIEEVTGRDWVSAIARRRKFSECMIYGRFVDEVEDGAGHHPESREFCRVHWSGSDMQDDAFLRFVDEMSPEQVAIGIQSFIGMDVARIRRLLSP